MSPSSVLSAQINGREPAADELLHAALVNYAHFSVMQVRDRSTRGLDLHLSRLVAAHRELFDSELDGEHVRSCLRDAIREHPDCTLRVTCFEIDRGRPLVLTVVRPPHDNTARPQSLTTVEYTRPLAHVKHVGMFAQIHFGNAAEHAGFDDAVLITPDGRIAETTIGNLGFVAADATIVWPDAPQLSGITRQLLDLELERLGRDVVARPITPDTLAGYAEAFVTNSTGVAAVARIGDHAFTADGSGTHWLSERYESIPSDAI
ncbi:MAG TPA: aminotransferase class IV [Jatrophihabitans sp.]|nr:aminotransferase class IV [Jatrophihabitans sp.]